MVPPVMDLVSTQPNVSTQWDPSLAIVPTSGRGICVTRDPSVATRSALQTKLVPVPTWNLWSLMGLVPFVHYKKFQNSIMK